jgi:amidophosphoribosyltransferase
MYPDCYGIDMSQLGRFIAFEAAVSLLQSGGEDSLLDEVESRCLAQIDKPAEKMVNHVRLIYDQFSHREIEGRIGQLVRADDLQWTGDIEVRYQTVDGLRDAMPGFTGDWYFTGDYPTPGGYKVLNTAYLKWRKNDQTRSYEPSSPATQPSG